MPKFASNLSMMFQEWAFLDRFQAAADAGFQAVEFLFPYAFAPDRIAAAARSAGVEIVLFNLPPGDWDKGDRGMACQPHRIDTFRASVDLARAYALELQVPRVHVMAGLGSASDPASLQCYRENLRFAAGVFGDLGVDILIEPLNGRDMPGYFLNDFSLAADIIRDLGLPNLKLQYDIYHRQILHGDVLKSLEALLPLIGHIQTASVPLRQEPGTGELNDAAIFAALDALGYQGSVGCEYRPAKGTLDGLGWFQSLKR